MDPLLPLHLLRYSDIRSLRECISSHWIQINIIAGSLESAYSLIWGSHKIWEKGGGDTLDLL